MITEIHFVHAVTVPGTQMRQTEFRARQGWRIDAKPEGVMLSHEEHGRFSVRLVGYSVAFSEELQNARPAPVVLAASRGGKKNR